jgi:glutathione S-transferase
VKLYDSPFAPSPRRVAMFLAEKGIDIPREPVDISAGATRSEAFRAVNPAGEVPVLELDDGTRLTESLAICRYLEQLHPEPNLLGRSPLEQAQVEMWSLRLMFRLYVPISHAFRHTHRFWAGRVQQVPEYGALARQAALEELEALEGVMASRPFVAGERFTLADIVAFTTIEFGKPSDIRLQPSHVALRRWFDAVKARPSAAA